MNFRSVFSGSTHGMADYFETNWRVWSATSACQTKMARIATNPKPSGFISIHGPISCHLKSNEVGARRSQIMVNWFKLVMSHQSAVTTRCHNMVLDREMTSVPGNRRFNQSLEFRALVNTMQESWHSAEYDTFRIIIKPPIAIHPWHTECATFTIFATRFTQKALPPITN